MQNKYKLTFGLLSISMFFSFTPTLVGQVIKQQKAFRKGSLLVSISEGSTSADYSTNFIKNPELPESDVKTDNPPGVHTTKMDGIRDPLFIEFGLSDRWGIGLSTGNDIFKVDPAKYYGFKLPENKTVTANTSEFTFDVNYHVFTRAKTDISIYSSVGSFGVAFNGKEGDYDYKYNAKGGIIRLGTKARYYFYKRLGVLGMVSYYSGSASPEDVKGNTVGTNVNTSIKGYALEFGLCFRFF